MFHGNDIPLFACCNERVSGSDCRKSPVYKPEKTALRLSDCTKVSLNFEGDDNSLQCYWTANAGQTLQFFCDFTQPKSFPPT